MTPVNRRAHTHFATRTLIWISRLVESPFSLKRSLCSMWIGEWTQKRPDWATMNSASGGYCAWNIVFDVRRLCFLKSQALKKKNIFLRNRKFSLKTRVISIDDLFANPCARPVGHRKNNFRTCGLQTKFIMQITLFDLSAAIYHQINFCALIKSPVSSLAYISSIHTHSREWFSAAA
jgi:hypothetical protein